jgi:hypothetical protein
VVAGVMLLQFAVQCYYAALYPLQIWVG